MCHVQVCASWVEFCRHIIARIFNKIGICFAIILEAHPHIAASKTVQRGNAMFLRDFIKLPVLRDFIIHVFMYMQIKTEKELLEGKC